MMHSTANELVNAITGAFDFTTVYDSPSWGLIDYLHNNIFAFSAAKSLTEYEAFGKMLTDEKGKIRTFNEFRRMVDKTNLRYNELYLRSEYDSAIAQSQNAARFNEFEQNRAAGEEVEYRTSGDERVRDSHKALDGMIFHIDDEILNTIAPQNDWGCRCLLVQVDRPHAHTPTDEAVAATKNAKIPAYFKNNPGRSGMIYDDGHPYFSTSGALSNLSAVKHYAMKTIEQIYMRPDKLIKSNDPFKDLTALKAWWQTKIMGDGSAIKNSFPIKCAPLNDLHIVLDDDLYKRFLSGKYAKELRYELASNIEKILTEPDEIWTTLKGKKRGKSELLTCFIKYFDDKQVVVVVRTVRDKGFGYVRMTSVYAPDKKSLENWRSGILRYKKTD